jgi:hypothetical protein
LIKGLLRGKKLFLPNEFQQRGLQMSIQRECVSLNGDWDIVFDPSNTGKDKDWGAKLPGGKQREKLNVPGVWEQIRPGYDGVAWYERMFDVKEDWLDGVIRLKFDAVHYFCDVFVNGEAAGSHEGGGAHFALDVTKLVKAGENKVTLRVIGPPIDSEIEGFRSGAPLNQGSLPVGKAGWYFNYGGIWQDVALEVTDRLYVDNLFVKPFPSKKNAKVIVTVINKGKARTEDLTVAVNEDKSGKQVLKTVKAVKLKRGVNEVSCLVKFDTFTCWDCENPFLYRATASIGSDESSDRFGMREFTIKNGLFTLNGKRITLKGFLQQGTYPRTLIFPDTKEMGLNELKLMKDNGYNFVRAHLRVPNRWWLDACDEMGILVQGEPGIGWVSNHPDTERRCRTEIEAMLLRDRNHPSIVFWCLLNEAYHFLGFTMQSAKALTDRLAQRGRKLDDTRLMMDTSGGDGSSDVTGGVSIFMPNQKKRGVMTDDHAYCPMPVADADIAEYRTMGRKGIPLFISEFGAPLVPPDYPKVLKKYTPAEKKLGLEDYVLHRDFYESFKEGFTKAGLKKTFGTPSKMIQQADCVRGDEMKLITKAQRSNPTLVGTAFCQLADASGEEFGATDIFREPKQTFHCLTEAFQTPMVAPELTPRVQLPGQKSKLLFTLVNEDQVGKTYKYVITIVNEAGRKVADVDSGTVDAKSYVQTVVRKTIQPDLKPGRYSLRITLNGTFRKGEIDFTVLEQASISTKQVSLWDPEGVMKPFFSRHKVECSAYINNFRDKSMPVVMDMRQWSGVSRQLCHELLGQLKKIVQTGGTAVLINPQPLLLQYELFDTPLRPALYMRNVGYVKQHPVFNGLPSDCVADYAYAGIFPNNYEKGEDVLAAGGEVLCGGLSQNMWTRPANYNWGAGVYTIPIGRGQVICCQMNILNQLADSVTSQIMLSNLGDYAASKIKPGLEHLLLSRCIDPLKPADYA